MSIDSMIDELVRFSSTKIGKNITVYDVLEDARTYKTKTTYGKKMVEKELRRIADDLLR